MLGRKHKKRQASISSVDLLSAASSTSAPAAEPAGVPSRAFNYLVERARGAVGFGGRERSRTTSDEGSGQSALSSSPTSKPFFSRVNSSDGRSSTTINKASLPFSASVQDLAAPPRAAAGGGGAFFRRPSTTSNPSRPGWLAPTAEGTGKSQFPSPLTSSPSSPVLSIHANGTSEISRRDTGGGAEGGKRPAGPAGFSSDKGDSLLTTSRKTFSRSVEDLSNRRASRLFIGGAPPVPSLARRSTDELSRDYHRTATPTSTLESTTTRRARTTSLAPSSALDSYPSPALSSSAPSSRGSPSPSPSRTPLNSDPSVPFPTSASSPNLVAASPTRSPSPAEGDRRRDSQTVLCQGLLQRKGDYVPATGRALQSPSATSALTPGSASPGISQSSASYFAPRTPSPLLRLPKGEVDLQRGWKPYRAILKGSKLYLHKLPGDLSTTAKHVFPSTVIDSASLSPAASPLLGGASPSMGEDGTKKKHRAFWGTGGSSHPGLVIADAGTDGPKILGGTLEALIHELVFGTTFAAFNPPPTVLIGGADVEEELPAASSDLAPLDSVKADDDSSLYDDFLSSLLLAWPALPFSPSQAASELDRCTGLAVRAAVDTASRGPDSTQSASEMLAKRLRLIVSTICEKYPQDLRRTDKGRVVPSELKVALEEVVTQLRTLEGSSPGLPDADSLATSIEATFSGSDGLKTKSKPLTEWPALPSTPQGRAAFSGSGSPTKTRKRLPSEQESTSSMTAQSLLQLDPNSFAAQIHLFHLDRLAAISGNISTARHLLRTASLILSTDGSTRQTAITSLFSFSPASPHFLTRIALQTILSAGSSTSGNTLFSPANAASPNEARAAVLSHWIDVGEELKRRGDAAGWVAVASALCCRAVARLEETWRSLAAEKIQSVREQWAPTLYGVGFIDFEETRVGPFAYESAEPSTGVPYLGSILEETVSAIRSACPPQVANSGVVDMLPLYALREKLEHVAGIWTQEPLAALATQPDHRAQLFLQTSSRIAHPDKAHLSAYLTASFEAEPRPSTQHLGLHFKARSPADPSPLLPLLMVEPLPHISLVDREKVLNSGTLPRKQSTPGPSTSTSAAVSSSTRLARHSSYPPHNSTPSGSVSVFTRLRNEIASPSDTLLRFADGDIVFRIISTAAPTLPLAPSNERGVLSRTSSWIESRSSRTKSARTSTGSNIVPLSRTSSKRESSPTASRSPDVGAKLQVAGEEEPVHVVVKAGTVETLVDLLVLGTTDLKTPSTDADGQASLSGRRPLSLDMAEYRSAFFATFRSFSSPLVVLDMLRKRYLAAPNASLEHVNLTPAKPFPTWSMAPTPESSEWDWERIANIRLGVLTNLSYWMQHHVSDFLDDDDLWSSALTFLQFVESTEQAAVAKRPDDDAVLAEVQRTKKRFGRESLRPSVKSRSARKLSGETPSDLNFDKLEASELVDELDQVASGVSRDLTEDDLLRYVSVLENSALSDPAAWYPSRHPPKIDEEELVITDTYSHTANLANDAQLARRMPASLQAVLATHNLFRRWVLAHLVDPDLSLRQRQARMLKAIQMLEICRSRMSNVWFGGASEALSSVLDPSLASFVERAVASAVVSPESRLFASAWSSVAKSQGASSPESLIALLHSKLVVTDATATLDVAWLNERLVEIATQVDSLSEGISINFSKRRWMFNTVRNALAISQPSSELSGDVLQQLERRLEGWGSWSQRVLRDVASGEGTKVTKSVKPFSRLVAQQQEKVRRDKASRELVSKGQKLEQQGRLQREKEVAKAMDKSVSVRTRRMTSLFHFGRPVSTMNPSAPSPPLPAVASPSPQALQSLRDWTPTGKPYLVLTLSGVEVQPYDNSQRSFVFELSTEDGQRSLFQAPSREELRNWVSHFKKSGTQIAFRRATFLAQTALAEEPEEVIAAPAKTTRSPPPASNALFYVPLWELLQREKTNVPRFVEKALEVIEGRGLSEVGIYRISGENRVINELKESLNRGGDPSTLLATTDVHNVTGLLKFFLRELPEPLIPFDLYDHFITANLIEDYDERLYAIRDLIWKMPQPNFQLMRRLTEHLDKVTDNEDVNAMHAANLSIIFAPTLLKPPPGPASFGLSMSNLGQAANIVKSLILQQNWIFGEEEEATATADVDEAAAADPVGLGLDTTLPSTLVIGGETLDTPLSIVSSAGAVVGTDGASSSELPSVLCHSREATADTTVSIPSIDTALAPTATSPVSAPRSPSTWFEQPSDAEPFSLAFDVKTPPPPPFVPPPPLVGQAYIDSLSLPSPISTESLFVQAPSPP